MTDLINHPAHYKTASGLEAIDIIEQFLVKEEHLDQVLKYVLRAGKKDDKVQDLRKAAWYLDRTITNLTKDDESLDSEDDESEENEFIGFDKDQLYTDSEGDVWEFFGGFWGFGSTQGVRRESAAAGKRTNPPVTFGPYVPVGNKQSTSKVEVYTRQFSSEGECYHLRKDESGKWKLVYPDSAGISPQSISDLLAQSYLKREDGWERGEIYPVYKSSRFKRVRYISFDGKTYGAVYLDSDGDVIDYDYMELTPEVAAGGESLVSFEEAARITREAREKLEIEVSAW